MATDEIQTQENDVQIVPAAVDTTAVVNIDVTEVSRDEMQNRDYMKAVETSIVDPVVDAEVKDNTVVEVPAVVEVDFLAEASKKYNREITEEYFTKDWKQEAEANSTKLAESQKIIDETRTKLEDYKHIFDNKDLLAIADKMKAGVKPKDILEAMSIDVDAIPENQKILDYVSRTQPYLKTKEDIELYIATNFNVDEDLRTDAPGEYFKNRKNLEEAINEQNTFLNERKIQLLNQPAPATSDSMPIIAQEQIIQSQNAINQHIDSLTNVQVTSDFTQPYDKAALKAIASNIAFSGAVGNDTFTMVKNVDGNKIAEALYFYENKDTLINELKTELSKSIAKEKSVEAFRKVSDVYDNVQGSVRQNQDSLVSDLKIEEVGRKASGGW
jgi:hypothetical protein